MLKQFEKDFEIFEYDKEGVEPDSTTDTDLKSPLPMINKDNKKLLTKKEVTDSKRKKAISHLPLKTPKKKKKKKKSKKASWFMGNSKTAKKLDFDTIMPTTFTSKKPKSPFKFRNIIFEV